MVYVDRLFECGRRSGWTWPTACHLYADTIEELHEFAHRLRLSRGWFQDKPPFPHYDLTPGKRQLAVRLGAIEASRQHGCEFRRAQRHEQENA